MDATNPTGMIVTIETAEDLIVMMTAVEVMAQGMMTAAVVMVLGMMTAEEMSTGTMTAIALATNATTMMMMTVTKAETGLLTIATEVMWITGTGIGMKGHGVLLVRQKGGANMEGIDQF
jgi:hypothetical protein